MRYVERDKDGNITGLFAQEQQKDQEVLPVDDAEVVVFINRPSLDSELPAIDKTEIMEADKQSLRDATTIAGIKSALLKILLNE